MDQDDRVYQLPADHDQQVAQFTRWMLIGIFALILILGSLIWFADRLLQQVPFAAERDFVAPYIEIYHSQRDLSVEEVKTERYLQDLADGLAKRMNMPNDITVDVHLIDSDDMNAFATLGGNIFVLQGLIDAMPDENSLSMVLAHELGHIKHRDPIVSISRGLAFQVAYSFIAGDGSLVLSTGSELGMLFFSREQEREADKIALVTLQNYYGHVAGATTFFEQALIIEEEASEDAPEWMHSHPKLQNRIDQLNADIEENFWVRGKAQPLEL
ncbi:M48 family metallopeptidase [Neptuniibacter sp. QD48_55]|uniref:M48 family metallopeptidase n=1 Tax=Neptuniibacter sp. QD48_55 TaxID=3398212 RepID=UPI0039F61DD4